MISIHAPLVGRDRRCTGYACIHGNFNPRAPRGARLLQRKMYLRLAKFQSTRPSWGATRKGWRIGKRNPISIHAPLVGRDKPSPHKRRTSRNFNPRAPRGARHVAALYPGVRAIFQSTRPSWGATRFAGALYAPRDISIHAPLVGRDTAICGNKNVTGKFQSTRPSWGATLATWRLVGKSEFQSTRPSWGATNAVPKNALNLGISIHAPLVGRDSSYYRQK